MYYINPEKEFKTLDIRGYLTNNLDDPNYRSLVFRPEHNFHFETSLVNWCRSTFMSPDKDFVDIGAHIGTWSWGSAADVNMTHAFECNSHVYNLLCANIYLKNLSHKIKTYNCGLSNKGKGTMTYFKRGGDGGGNGLTELRPSDTDTEKVEVNVCRLDDFNLDNVGFMKIDVEGHEREVLEGALETLKRNNYPTFTFESWAPWRDDEGQCPARKLRTELFEYIESIGYKVIPVNGWDEQFIAEYVR